jgi:hypothetical protein
MREKVNGAVELRVVEAVSDTFPDIGVVNVRPFQGWMYAFATLK